MRIRYDREVDALGVAFRDTTVTTKELAEGIVAEYDDHGHFVGWELLDASARFGEPSALSEVTLEGVGLGAPMART